MFQAGLRSAIAALLLWGWAAMRGTPLFRADGTFVAGLSRRARCSRASSSACSSA
jgi:hypothetical protein